MVGQPIRRMVADESVVIDWRTFAARMAADVFTGDPKLALAAQFDGCLVGVRRFEPGNPGLSLPWIEPVSASGTETRQPTRLQRRLQTLQTSYVSGCSVLLPRRRDWGGQPAAPAAVSTSRDGAGGKGASRRENLAETSSGLQRLPKKHCSDHPKTAMAGLALIGKTVFS